MKEGSFSHDYLDKELVTLEVAEPGDPASRGRPLTVIIVSSPRNYPAHLLILLGDIGIHSEKLYDAKYVVCN